MVRLAGIDDMLGYSQMKFPEILRYILTATIMLPFKKYNWGDHEDDSGG
jgi:hypothetical protein